MAYIGKNNFEKWAGALQDLYGLNAALPVCFKIQNDPLGSGDRERTLHGGGLFEPRRKEPVCKIAYRGLYSNDEHLKGMALEYLGSVLPAEVRSVLTR